MVPAGGVAFGWQLALRSKNVYGPYEVKRVMAQGSTDINGPHQGAWVETNSGESWFVHFQDKVMYGRVIHLNPVKWINDWPVIGEDCDGDGCGEPVQRYRKPNVGKTYPVESDEFNSRQLGLQWEWHANYQDVFGFTSDLGYMRIYGHVLSEDFVNFWEVSNLLLQKFPAEEFTAIPDAPRDASAAAIVASALLELFTYLSVEKGVEYENAVIKMLKSLSSDKYRSGKNNPSFLLHSTGHWPAKSEIDASIIYADYYYIEALLRLKKMNENKVN